MPQSKPSSYRGIIVHRGHSWFVTSVAFSPDGKSVASGSGDASIRIWDVYRPVPIGNPWNGHTSGIWSICYSRLGNMIVSGSGDNDNTVRLWDTQTGQQIGEALQGHHGGINSVTLSPSGTLVASGAYDKTVRLWNVRTSATSSGSLQGHTGWVGSVAFSPNNTRVVSGSGDKTIRMWDIERQAMVGEPLQGHESAVRAVSFSPDGSQIISGSFDNTLRLWDVRTGSMVGTPFEGHTDSVLSVAFSPSGTYVASGSMDNKVRIWDTRTHSQAEDPFEQHTERVFSVAFSPCGRRIASGSDDKAVMIWNMLGNDPVANLDSYTLAEEKDENNKGSNPENTTAQTSQVTAAQDIFDRLSRDGCIDLTSQMDPELDTTVLKFRDDFGDIWEGDLRNGTGVQLRKWRAPLIEQCSKETLERAIKDIQTWSKMKHKNVHQLMGIAIPDGSYLGLITGRMENGRLHEYMRSNPLFDRNQMCTQITTGLVYMHQLDLVHGDLKAFNVLVSSSGVAKLTNFGLSALSAAYVPISEANNRQNGAARWVAPELLSEGASKTKTSDVYALGMTMLEVITGDVPYRRCKWEFQVLSQVIQGALPLRPVELKDDESGNHMWELLTSCWNKSPDLRPSVKEVVVSLIVTATD